MMTMESPLQRSTTNTPQQQQQHNHHHYYSTPTGGDQQPKSFTNSLVSNHSQHSYLNRGGGQNVGEIRRTTPRLYTPTNYSGGGGRKNRSQTQSPRSHSSSGGDGGSNILLNDSIRVLPPGLHHLNSHHPHHNHHLHPHQQLGDNINLMLNSSGSGGSHSITPPNSNSNTTISCGSGNSTSANIGVPTTPKTTLNHNNNHIKQTDRENLRNNNNRTSSTRPKAKKCILEEEDDDNVEKCAGKNNSNQNSNNNNSKGARTRTSWVGLPQELLPVCDALFNVISLAIYFCDIVFDVLTAYTWYKMSQETEDDFLLLLDDPHAQEAQRNRSAQMWIWSIVALCFIACSALLSQSLSFKWYKQSPNRGQIGPDGIDLEGPPTPCSTSALVIMHLSLCGVLWRYFKLFIPVDLRFVKNEVRDLCLLRLVHAFCEAIPMLLIQLYLIWGSSGPQDISDFTIVSTSLSLFSVCWALASFSKNIRKQNVHKLVLTWLGVIFQFGWHFGTIISRVVALSLYATVYHFWIFLVLILHYFCMLLWLISPKNLYHGEKLSTFRKVIYSALLAIVYTFCYINVQESNSRQKVIIYYVTMFLENSLLLSVWLIAKRYEDEIWYKNHVISAVFLCFGGGILFMALYYRYFHLKRLSYVYDTESSIYRSTSVLNGASSSININSSGGAIYPSYKNSSSNRSNREAIELSKNKNSIISPTIKELNGGGTIPNGLGMIISHNGSQNRYNKRANNSNVGSAADKVIGGGASSSVGGGGRGAVYNKINGHHIHHPNVPGGVFNCRFNPAMKRKKKKPSSFVPPPPAVRAQAASPAQVSNNDATTTTCHEDVIQNQTLHNSINSNNNNSHERRRSSTHLQDNVMNNKHGMVGNGGGLLEQPTTSPGSLSSSGLTTSQNNGSGGSGGCKLPPILPGGRMSHPFWKRPLCIAPQVGGGGSENEGSVGSRVVDIQQKLQEKKQQQLAELKEIEEEIKQGKLKRPPQFNEIPGQPVTVCQPIPGEKKKPWFRGQQQLHDDDDDEFDPRSMMDPPPLLYYPRPPFMMIPGAGGRSPNEVILDPGQYLMYASPTLDGSTVEECCYYDNPDWPIPSNYYEPEPMYQNEDEVQHEHCGDHSSGSAGLGGIQRRRRNAKNRASKESIYKSYRMQQHSDIDIDSQMSLPRSYTLPREFKYKRKFRKPIKNEQFLPSTNSSDGDVDSGEEDPEIYGTFGPFPLPLPTIVSHVVLQHGKNNTPPPNNNGNNNHISSTSASSSAPPHPNKQKHPMMTPRRPNKLPETKL